jgi:Ca2+-binding RTX toxin-like protein
MANISILSPVDMHNVSTWFGAVAAADAVQIEIVSGSFQETYTGNFTYDAGGNVYGSLTGLSETISGLPILSASGLNVCANYAAQLINSNQIPTFVQVALGGDDQFTLQPGTHVIDGYGGYNTVTEASSYSNYTISNNGSSVLVGDSTTYDSLYNIRGVYFQDGFYDARSASFSPSTPSAGFAAADTTSGQPVPGPPQSYTGPVIGLQHDYITSTSDSLTVGVSTDNWFIHTGRGTDAIAAHGGTNVLDGGTGSNFLTGGNGVDTFFVDDRVASADIWRTVVGFRAGDAATIWGVTPQDFNLAWADSQGATGYTGLTLHATAVGKPIASLTLAGFTSADLTDGRLSVSFGTTAATGGVVGSTYMYAHAT